jgi:SAM-dependent methyltransferase
MNEGSQTDPHDQARLTRDKLSALYSDAPDAYEELWAPELAPLSRELLAHLPLDQASQLLEVGAGVGTLLPELGSRAPAATIVASDLSLGMLRLAPKQFPRVIMDAARLGFREKSFDLCVAAFVLFHLFDPEAGVVEMARVLRSGGFLGTITWGEENEPVSYRVWAEELERHDAPPLDSDFGRFELVDTPLKVETLMAGNGLRVVRSWVGEYRVTPTPDEFLAHRTRLGRSRQRVQAMEPDALARCLERAREQLHALRAEDFEEISEVVYVIGQKE